MLNRSSMPSQRIAGSDRGASARRGDCSLVAAPCLTLPKMNFFFVKKLFQS